MKRFWSCLRWIDDLHFSTWLVQQKGGLLMRGQSISKASYQ